MSLSRRAARNNWHVHHKRRTNSLVTAGRGWYQGVRRTSACTEAGRCCQYSAGSKALARCGKDSSFAHIAIEVPAEGSSNEWLRTRFRRRLCKALTNDAETGRGVCPLRNETPSSRGLNVWLTTAFGVFSAAFPPDWKYGAEVFSDGMLYPRATKSQPAGAEKRCSHIENASVMRGMNLREDHRPRNPRDARAGHP